MTDQPFLADGETLHFPFDDKPHRMRVGLRPAASEAEWFEVDGNYARDLGWKADLLRERHDEVVAALPGSHEAGAELFGMVADNMATHHPALVHCEADGWVLNRVTGEQVRADGGLHPVDAAARLVQEDLLVLEPRPDGATLIAGSLCFPGRWLLHTKMGLPMSGIHAPVGGFVEHLGNAADVAMRSLVPERPMWRINWSLHNDSAYFQPGSESRRATVTPPHITAHNAGDTVFLRVERQGLRRLPRTGAIVFGIRTHVWPLAIISGMPDRCAQMATHLRTLDPDFARYKGQYALEAPVLAWLDART